MSQQEIVENRTILASSCYRRWCSFSRGRRLKSTSVRLGILSFGLESMDSNRKGGGGAGEKVVPVLLAVLARYHLRSGGSTNGPGSNPLGFSPCVYQPPQKGRLVVPSPLEDCSPPFSNARQKGGK
jgi:hypothetical protein